MAKHLYIFKTITVLTLVGAANFTCAEVIRCEAGTGDVTYTNTDCSSDVQTTQVILVEKPLARNVTYQQPSKTAQVRSSNWANVYIAPRTGKVDAESVRSARLRMISMDGTSRHRDSTK